MKIDREDFNQWMIDNFGYKIAESYEDTEAKDVAIKYAQSKVENLGLFSVVGTLPSWYKSLTLLELQMKALQEDIPINLHERRGEVKDLESFDMLLTAMRAKLSRAIKELEGN